MNAAETQRRFFAYLIDLFLLGIFAFPLLVKILLESIFPLNGQKILLSWSLLGVILFLTLAYEFIFIRYLKGLPGQIFLGLSIVDETDPSKRLESLQVLIRILADKLNWLIGPSIYVFALLNHERKTLSDYFAETRVVQKVPRYQPAKVYLYSGGLLMIFLFAMSIRDSVITLKDLKYSKQGVEIGSFIHQ